jgi:hypothetical protein
MIGGAAFPNLKIVLTYDQIDLEGTEVTFSTLAENLLTTDYNIASKFVGLAILCGSELWLANTSGTAQAATNPIKIPSGEPFCIFMPFSELTRTNWKVYVNGTPGTINWQVIGQE